MGIRDHRQLELARKWIDSGKWGIINAAPRVGKIRTSILIMQEIKPSSVLIAYPDNKIKQSWQDDFKKFGFSGPTVVTFSTFLSLYKEENKMFDLIILDEIHLLSENQIVTCNKLLKNNKQVLGLSGTLSSWTEKVLREDLHLPVVARYSIETAIREGILPDYEINIVRVPLDRFVKNQYGKKYQTEKKRFDTYKYVADKLEEEGKENFFIKLKLISVLQKSIAKKNKTIELIEKFKEDRLLVFCGRTEIADNLGIPSYHSKTKEKQIFDDFVQGISKHLAVIRIGNMGVTYTPLNKLIINYFDSNEENMTQKILRAMSLEYDNPDKKAVIYIVTSTEETELRWLSKSLVMFDNEKINVI